MQLSTKTILRSSALLAGLMIVLAAGIACAAPSGAKDGVARIHLIWTNDMHGYVDPRGATFMSPDFPPPLGGGASAAAYVNKLRAALAHDPDSDLLIVDAGDTWQGSPVGSLTEGRVMEDYYNLMGYDAVVPGNHEFDAGKQVPIRISAGLNHKMLCANILDAATGKIVDWCEPYRVVERGGLRIGLLGATTPSTGELAFAQNIEGLRFAPLKESLEKYRDILKKREKVDIIFAIIHEGLPYDAEEAWQKLREREDRGEDIAANPYGLMDLAHVMNGVPVMVGGHTHRGYQKPWIDPVTHTMVFETFGKGSSIGHVILKVDRATGELLGYEMPLRGGTLVTLFEDEWWPDEAMSEVLRPYLEEANKGLSVAIGNSRTELSRLGRSNSPMGNLVCDAMRQTMNADFAFSNTGGVRADLSRGDITEGDLLEVLPFGNSISVVSMSGRLIRQVIERKSGESSSGFFASGAEMVVDPSAEQGKRLLQCRIGGKPLDPDRHYRVVTSDFLMEGNSGLEFLAQIDPELVEYSGVLIRDAVRLYLKDHSPVSPRIDGRFREETGGSMAPYLVGW